MVWEAKIANFSSKERNISMAFTEHYFVEVSIFTIKNTPAGVATGVLGI